MKRTKLIYIGTLFIFGSIGLFVRNIQLSSGQIALSRGFIGSVFLILSSLVMKRRISWKAIKPNLVLLLLSGAAIGFNWILLFQAYKYTSIANATLCYYFQPVFVMFLSPIILKERLTLTKIISILAAVLGMFCIVGNGGTGSNHLIGILYGLSAAILYASVILMNKFFKGLSGLDTTIVQLSFATLILLPYILITETISITQIDRTSFVYLMIVCILHTGIAYLLYFTSIRKLSAQTIAIFSYIDPISAIMLSSILLREKMTLIQILGGGLILGASLYSELYKGGIKNNIKRNKEKGNN